MRSVGSSSFLVVASSSGFGSFVRGVPLGELLRVLRGVTEGEMDLERDGVGDLEMEGDLDLDGDDMVAIVRSCRLNTFLH